MILIESIDAREILDSRGNPTVEAVVETKEGVGKASVPSGASTGSKEALELRDGGDRFGGKGVQDAVNNIRESIGPELIGEEVTKQTHLDNRMIELDGEEDKSDLGANAILAVSLAAARAAADSLGLPLYRYLGRSNDRRIPVPFMNVLNGGEHAGNDLDIQEYMIVPSGGDNFKEGLRIGAEVYQTLGEIIEERYGANATNLGDEGGYAPPLKNPTEPFELMMSAIEECGYEDRINFAIDTAATELKTSHGYKSGDEVLNTENMIQFYEEMIEKYPLISIEDPLGEDDWEGFVEMTERFGSDIQIVGDDIFVSNPKLIKKGIESKACNSVLLKVNQIGTLTEALDAASLSLKNGYDVMVSHRSGETSDAFIADLSVALSSGQIKSGAPARGERTSKYNRLLKIEEELGDTSRYGLF
ncbi:MAG: phosphopyruvate hydratase [Candidatus Thermoplasmatota archaeon]|nr:phosphopyruvate hydratase [Candidatus Thermoplasmatota archaeon]